MVVSPIIIMRLIPVNTGFCLLSDGTCYWPSGWKGSVWGWYPLRGTRAMHKLCAYPGKYFLFLDKLLNVLGEFVLACTPQLKCQHVHIMHGTPGMICGANIYPKVLSLPTELCCSTISILTLILVSIEYFIGTKNIRTTSNQKIYIKH